MVMNVGDGGCAVCGGDGGGNTGGDGDGCALWW